MLSQSTIETINPNLSTEEKDHLERSNKKIKSDHLVDTVTMDEDVVSIVDITEKEHAQDQEMSQPPSETTRHPTKEPLGNHPSGTTKSFKDAVLKSKANSKEEIEKRIAEFEDSDVEDMESDETHKTKSKIRVEFSKDQLQRFRQQYKGCLIIKLLGRNIGFKLLMDKISHLWNLEGMFVPVDLGLGFYLIKFESKSDYTKVFTGGPWIIQDHYLTVRKWIPEFKADMAMAMNTAVWLRIPLLPLEFHDEEGMETIAKALGKILKIDNNTVEARRGSMREFVWKST